MKTICALIFALCIIFTHYTVLQGYILYQDDTVCIKSDDSSGEVSVPSVTEKSAAELAKTCTLLSVEDVDKDGML